ncbi:hypothetical protein [Bacillus velezensis]|uniref:hypothetical protein n=1 Tax=Bacillus velezensis TaxID=492670 RepID=UPI0021F1053A|nr:hypothetical protein [Bacillus velezensis]MCV4329341.1 hypothetical protein [Bacillus velezensis]
MLSRSPRKRGAFSPSDALLLAPHRNRRPRSSFSYQGGPAWPGHKKSRRLIGSGIRLPRSFDETQRFHGAALPVLSQSPRKRGAFSPSDALLLEPHGTDGHGSPSAARAARCLSGCKKEPVPFSRLCLYYHLKGEKRLWKKLSSKLPKQ